MVNAETRRAPHHREIRQRFIEERGSWDAMWEPILQRDPQFLEAYIELSSIPAAGPLDQVTEELVYVAINAAPTHRFEAGLRRHIRNALRCGASQDQIVLVLLLCFSVGALAFEAGVSALEATEGPADEGKSPCPSEHADEGRVVRKPMGLNLDHAHGFAPTFVDRFRECTASIWRREELTERQKHLVCLAIASLPSALSRTGIEFHTRGALAAGGTVAEIVQVSEMVGLIGVQSLAMGLPVLGEESLAHEE